MITPTISREVAHDRWLAADRAAIWERAEVVDVERRATITRLRLRLGTIPDLRAGQYYLVRVAVDTPPGVVEQAYSLCSSPYPPSTDVEIAVREVVGGRVSPLLAHEVQVGDQLHVRGPYGSLTWTDLDDGPLGLIGAGTGVAPLVSLVRYAAARQLVVPMTLLSSSRNPTTALLVDELEELAVRASWFTFARTYTRDPQDRSSQYHRRVDAAMLAEVFVTHDIARRPSTYFVAGPHDMVIATRTALSSLGVADELIYSEDHV